MPIYRLEKIVDYGAYIQAPTLEEAKAEVSRWSRADWGQAGGHAIYGAKVADGTEPDYVVDLRGQDHAHEYGAGGCIYCGYEATP